MRLAPAAANLADPRHAVRAVPANRPWRALQQGVWRRNPPV